LDIIFAKSIEHCEKYYVEIIFTEMFKVTKVEAKAIKSVELQISNTAYDS